jgi:thiamine-monophosphate kinase
VRNYTSEGEVVSLACFTGKAYFIVKHEWKGYVMKINEIGEFGLIDRLKKDVLIRKYEGLIGIGDDCAVIKTTFGRYTLLTTDMLIEGVHFNREYMKPDEIGYKAMAVNLSDIAACGGIPKDALISLGVAEDVTVEYLEEIYRGIKESAEEFLVNIIGGDTTRSSSELIINVVIIGEVEDKPILRSGAKENDLICVTGYLGDSAAGMHLLTNNVLDPDDFSAIINKHLRPYPYVTVGRKIARLGTAHAMIDISDGLIADLKHVCKASRVGADIYTEKLPFSDSFEIYCEKYELDLLQMSLSGGEDYCLLLTLAESDYQLLKAELEAEHSKLFEIGRIVNGDEIRLLDGDGKEIDVDVRGWDHFGEIPQC